MKYTINAKDLIFIGEQCDNLRFSYIYISDPLGKL